MQWVYVLLVFVPVHAFDFNATHIAENFMSSPCTDKNHFFLAPGVLTAGGSNRACVSRFYVEPSARMQLSLLSENGQTTTASRELPPGDGGCLDISVPLLPNSKAELVVNIWYFEEKCTWERRVSLRISSGRVAVVHTERARYRPGETMRARVFAFKADLTPAPGLVEEIWIEGPPGAWEGTRVAQWMNVRSKLGLSQVQHEIDALAPPGRWTIRARLGDGTQGSAVFWVGNYELPPFQLTVRHSPRVLRTSDRLAWTVCVRYPWTEAVEGMLVIRLRGAGSDSPGIRTAVRLRAPRACHRHAAAARRVGLGGDHPPHVVVADFSFQEEGTRVWQNTTVVSQVVDKPITLEFVTHHHTVISPGLPYKLKVKATRWDEKPASNERIRVCRYSSQGDTTTGTPSCISGDTDSGGVARIMFPAEDDASPFYRFEASLYNDSTTTTSPLTLATRRSPIQATLGSLRADSKGTRTFVPLYLNLQNVTSPVTVHFVVITRGGIIYRWGATTQCPVASSAIHIQTAARHSKCNDPMPQYDDMKNQLQENKNQTEKNNINKNVDDKNKYTKNSRNYDLNINLYINNNQNINIHNYLNKSIVTRNMNQNDKNNYIHKKDKNEPSQGIYDKYSPVLLKPNVYFKTDDVNSILNEVNASDALLDRNLLRVMLPIKVTQQMCPDSHLIAYFYYNGEFVSASKHFEMDDCFVNKVEATFLSRQVPPGAPATLQLSTPGPALCALTAVDSAAKWSPSYAVKDVLMGGLRRMMAAHRNITEYDAAGDCFLSSDTAPLPSDNLELTAAWLAAAGVRTLVDVPLKKRCDTPASLVDEGTVPRSDFSEAWLWRLVTVGSNGSAFTTAQAPDSITRYEANAVCLSKSGVAVSQPAVLQVFREFFIHADGPRRLRRGDSTIIRYRLFNYLYEPLSVQIQIVPSPGVQGPANLVESVCVPQRASAARRSTIVATGAGDGRVVIRAKAVNDGGCGNHTTNRMGVSDEVVMKIIVEPEGVPVREQKSMLLCGKEKSFGLLQDNSNSTSSHVSWSFSPAAMVPGTETLTVWATGDIIGPLLADADSLVLLPRGCGEQNMARLATNLLACSHLHPHSAASLTAIEHVARGYIRQLQYVHPSGGFSAFGAADDTPSTWLTAFSIRYLRKTHRLLFLNKPIPPAIERAERWLLEQQMENGCFRNEGQVFHRELRGGMNEEGEIASVSLTAYVITSLVESTSPLPSRLLRNTLSCLRALPPLKYNPPARVYAHSLLAYAFVRMKKYEEELRKTNEARYEDLRVSGPNSTSDRRTPGVGGSLHQSGLQEHEGLLEVMELIKMATREGEYLWWETGSLSTSIEATGYALLALRDTPSALREFGAGAIRWLAAHRGASGGFLSTQDTLVALEALSAWSSLQPTPSHLTVTARTGPTSKVSKLDSAIPEVMNMGTGDQISIGVEGSGCALVQATRSYHAPSSARSQHQLSVELSLHTDGTFDCDSNGNNCFCAAIIEACAVWSGAFPEMALLEVSLPGGYGADAARLYSQLNEPNSLLRRIELTPTSSKATLYLAPRAGAPTTPGRGHACYNVHAVGPQTKTRPAYVRLMDYYRPSVNDTQIYTIPEECPSRVSHKPSQDISSDNLYNKARSTSDKGEILITHEFNFEDIPEGIPLEDPLYDNLTRKSMDKNDLRRNSTKINNKTNMNNGSRINNNFNLNSKINNNTNLNNTSIINKNIDLNNNSKTNHNISLNSFSRTNTIKTIKIIYDDQTNDNMRHIINNSELNNNGKTNETFEKNYTNKANNNSKIGSNSYKENNLKGLKENFNIEDNVNKNVAVPIQTVKAQTNDIDKIEQRGNEDPIDRYRHPYRNPLPYIPSDNDNIPPFRNVVLDIPKVIATNNLKLKPLNIDDKLDLRPNKIATSNVQDDLHFANNTNNIVKLTFVSGGKTYDYYYKTYDKIDEAKSDLDPNTKTDSKYSIRHEKQRSIATNATTANENSHSHNISNVVNDNKMITQKNEENEQTKSPDVDNPNLSDFHVIDSEKDLEVPSGVEGPVPSIVLPPPNFMPPQFSPNDFELPHDMVPHNFDPRHTQPNIFMPQKGIILSPQNDVPNVFSNDGVPNNYIKQHFVPIKVPQQNFAPYGYANQITSQINAPKGFFVQNPALTNFVPQNEALNNLVPKKSVPNNPNNLAPYNFQFPAYDMLPPSPEMVPPPPENNAPRDYSANIKPSHHRRRLGRSYS